MNKSESIDKLTQALVIVQSKLKNVPQKNKNPFFNSTYADLSTIIDHCRQLLAENGLAISQGNNIDNDGIIITTLLLHSSGQWLESQLKFPTQETNPQKIGGIITYGRRYAYAAILGISSEEDDDGNFASQLAKPSYKPSVTKVATSAQCPICHGPDGKHATACPNLL